MGTQPEPNSHFGLGRLIEGQVENFQLPQSAKNIAIFDDFDYPKMLTSLLRIGSPNRMYQRVACVMPNTSVWFGCIRVGGNGDRRWMECYLSDSASVIAHWDLVEVKSINCFNLSPLRTGSNANQNLILTTNRSTALLLRRCQPSRAQIHDCHVAADRPVCSRSTRDRKLKIWLFRPRLIEHRSGHAWNRSQVSRNFSQAAGHK